jgi:hypothetical protein
MEKLLILNITHTFKNQKPQNNEHGRAQERS